MLHEEELAKVLEVLFEEQLVAVREGVLEGVYEESLGELIEHSSEQLSDIESSRGDLAVNGWCRIAFA